MSARWARSSKGSDETARRAAAIARSCSPEAPAAATKSSTARIANTSTACRCGWIQAASSAGSSWLPAIRATGSANAMAAW